MSLFPNIECEGEIQIGDKIRLSAVKSFAAKGAAALTIVRIKPGSDESYISVFNAKPESWWLDWEFRAFKFDVDPSNNKIPFKESNALELSATIPVGTYTFDDLLTAIGTQMTALGSGTYTLTRDERDRVTISSTVPFSLLPETGVTRLLSLLQTLGFKKDTEFASSHQGKVTENCVRKVTVEISNGVLTETVSTFVKVFSVYGDSLFSSDSDIRAHEQDILKYVVEGRNSFLNFHRKAQKEILDFLRGQGFVDVDGEPLTKWAIVDKLEVNEWATYKTLALIFDDISNAVDDVFERTSNSYKGKAKAAQNRYLRLDLDNDGKADETENIRIQTGEIFRR